MSAITMPHCRLYLVTPRAGDDEHLSGCLRSAIEAGDVAAVLVRAADDGQLDARVESLIRICRPEGVAVLIDEDIECVKRTGADGVHVAESLDAYREAREVLGTDLIVGFGAGSSRHLAMAAGEAGADYVAFGDDPSLPEPLSAWWAELFEVPGVAMHPCTPEVAGRLAAADVEFVVPADDIWSDPERAGQLAAEYLKESNRAGATE